MTDALFVWEIVVDCSDWTDASFDEELPLSVIVISIPYALCENESIKMGSNDRVLHVRRVMLCLLFVVAGDLSVFW